jgi:hypothetical protein
MKLLRDWGTDPPISGGSGGSREDPIIVTATDPKTVALTQLLALSGIGRGRGIFWHAIGRTMLGEQWPGIEQFKVQTVELTDTQVVTQTENYYFDVSAMMSAGASSRRARNSRRIVRKCKGPLQLQRPFNFAAKCGLCPLFLLAAGLRFLAWA